MKSTNPTNKLGDRSNIGGEGVKGKSKKTNGKNNEIGNKNPGFYGDKGISGDSKGNAKDDRKTLDTRRGECLKNGLVAYSLKALAEYHMIDYSTVMRWKDKGLIIPITINAKLKKSKPLYLDRKTSRLIREGLIATNKDKNL